jgi:protein-S-isoprenylcysteine O-methyltransferase Ste14
MQPGFVDVRQEWWVRSRAWISILLLTPFAVAAAGSGPILSSDSPWRHLTETAGWTCFLAGVALRWWSTLYIGGRKRISLISEGPYSVCRNPLYVGSILIALSIAFYLPSLTFAAGLALGSLFYISATVISEEGRLNQFFGEEYVHYCRDVPRFFPRLRKPRTALVVEVTVEGLQAEAIRAARYVWVPVIAQTIAHLRFESWWPHWWLLP